jgi:hypothetical protein
MILPFEEEVLNVRDRNEDARRGRARPDDGTDAVREWPRARDLGQILFVISCAIVAAIAYSRVRRKAR